MDKNIIYIASTVLIIVIIVLIYNFSKTKQNFQQIKHRKPKVIGFSKEKMGKALMESVKKTIQKWEKNKIVAEKVYSLQRKFKQNQLRAEGEAQTEIDNEDTFVPSGVVNQETTPKPYDPNDIESDTTLLRRINECTLGRIYNLPEKNLENPSEFSKRDRRSIFRELNAVGDPDENSVRVMAPTIGKQALKNGFLSATKDTAIIEGKFVFCSNTRQFTQSISDKTTVSAGASFSAVTVKATASYLTQKDFKSDMNIQAYNISVRKLNQSLTMSPDNFKEEFLNPEMLKDLNDLGDTSLGVAVKGVLDAGSENEQPIILDGNENEETLYTKIPNTHIPDTAWLKCKEFFSKWGSHFVTSIDYGKKLNVWDTIITTEEQTTNLMEAKACLQLSYAGYTECTTKCEPYKKMKRLKENYDETDDIDWNAPVNWDPVPVPGTENLPPEGETTTTTTPKATTSTTTTTTLAPGGNTGGCDSCGSGQECVGYRPETSDKAEMMGNCVAKGTGGKGSGFSAGASICHAHKETSQETLSSASTTSQVLLQGGDDKVQAAIMAEKVGNSPGISQEKMIEFLQSDPSKDVPIKYTFKSLWSLLIETYGNKCGAFIEKVGNYKVRSLRKNCIGYLEKEAEDWFMNNGFNTFLKGPGAKVSNPEYTTKIVFQTDPKTLSLLDDGEFNYTLVTPTLDQKAVTADPEYCQDNTRLSTKSNYCVLVATDPFYVDTQYIPITSNKYVGKDPSGKEKTTPPPGYLTRLYHIFYVNDETKENRFEIFVPEYELSQVFDPCRILQAAYNLEAAYISDIVCPYKTTGEYGIIQKMIPLNISGTDSNGKFLQKYACWNKVTGCQSDIDCIGYETDQLDCSGFWTTSCDLNWRSCQQGGLWHESIMDSSINGPNTSPKEGQYRTLANRPANVPLQYWAGPAANQSSSFDESTDMRKWAQTSCLSQNSRFLPDGSLTSKLMPRKYNYDAKKCYCQNRYLKKCETPEEISQAQAALANPSASVRPTCLLGNMFDLDKYSGAVVLPNAKATTDDIPPNILPNRLVWNQARGFT